jgi:hypothetical protein
VVLEEDADVAAVRAHEVEHVAHHPAHGVGGARVLPRPRLREEQLDELVVDGEQDLVLATREVVVDRALRDADGTREMLDARRVIPVAVEEPGRMRDHLAPPARALLDVHRSRHGPTIIHRLVGRQ